MIYKKDANFPYPLLTNTSTSYKNSSFILDVDLQENINEYCFGIKYEITSKFIKRLLEDGQAQLILIIQAKDSKFYNIDLDETIKKIPKSRVSLNKRTTIQLLIQSKEDISFADNKDLSSFYRELSHEIIVPKNSVLGFSNSVIFEGSTNKPLEIFEKKINPNIKSDIKIEFGSETIIINYRNEELQFVDSSNSATLNNPYVYMGLQKALYRFIVNYSADGDEVDLDELEPPADALDFKLYNLMKNKMVHELSVENMDEVIYLISDKVLEKYTAAVRRMYTNAG